jgi:hypothetical protein
VVDPKTLPPLSKIFSDSWSRLQKNLIGYVLSMLGPWIFALVAILCMGVPLGIEQIFLAEQLSPETHALASKVLIFATYGVAMVVGLSAQGAMYRSIIEDLQEKRPAGIRALLGLPFGFFPMFWALFLRLLLSLILNLCCILPGVVCWHMLALTPAYMLDREAEAAEAAAAGWDALKGAPLWCLGLLVGLAVIRWLGRVTLLGMLVTEPLGVIVEVYAVRALFGKVERF